MNSLNHYAYGAIGEWIYERIAGIAPLEAGYKTIRIAPKPRQPLTSASGSVNTPYGKVSSSWEIVNNEFQIEVVVPPNTTAKVSIPANTQNDLMLNGVSFKDNSNVKLLKTNNNAFELLVQPGNYKFMSKL
jgi:alpha-L-rhamnosidase